MTALKTCPDLGVNFTMQTAAIRIPDCTCARVKRFFRFNEEPKKTFVFFEIQFLTVDSLLEY